MDAHRDRYQAAVVQPFRRLLEELAPTVLALDDRFDATGRTGANFSRINRDIRFAKDKTLYKTQMYLKFQQPLPRRSRKRPALCGAFHRCGHRWVPRLCRTKTARVHSGAGRGTARRRKTPLGRPIKSGAWAENMTAIGTLPKKGIGRSTTAGRSARRTGRKSRAGFVRRKMRPGEATKPGFAKELSKIFREVYPLLKFTTIP